MIKIIFTILLLFPFSDAYALQDRCHVISVGPAQQVFPGTEDIIYYMISFVCYNPNYNSPDDVYFFENSYSIDDINDMADKGEFTHKVETLQEFLNKAEEEKTNPWPKGM